MKKLRCVVDTNVLISASLIQNSTPARALQFILQREVLLLSQSVYLELYQKIQNEKKFGKYVALDERLGFVDEIGRLALKIVVTESIDTCRDKKDNQFLELAVSGKADYLISGDPDLLSLHPFRKIDILTPRQFLEVFNQQVSLP